jgi:thiamine biosynthesis lipoprotein
MGSFFEVRIPARTPGGVELATAMLDRIEALEAQLTVYRDDSEVSRLNATAHEAPVAVRPNLFALLQRGLKFGSETEGAFDLAIGALSAAWGFTRGPRRVPSIEEQARAIACSGQVHLTLDPATQTVAFDTPGVVINLGAIGKGHAIDQVVALLSDHWWPVSGLVHGGQSSIYALGSPPDAFGGRWDVALHNPFHPEAPMGILKLRDQAIGTSGSWLQSFEVEGRKYGHILDPRTGVPPADGPASVTVVAPDATTADALSTAFYLMGPAAAARYLATHPGLAALFVLPGRHPGTLQLQMIGLDPAHFHPNPDYEQTWTPIPNVETLERSHPDRPADL